MGRSAAAGRYLRAARAKVKPGGQDAPQAVPAAAEYRALQKFTALHKKSCCSAHRASLYGALCTATYLL